MSKVQSPVSVVEPDVYGQLSSRVWPNNCRMLIVKNNNIEQQERPIVCFQTTAIIVKPSSFL